MKIKRRQLGEIISEVAGPGISPGLSKSLASMTLQRLEYLEGEDYKDDSDDLMFVLRAIAQQLKNIADKQ